MSPKELMYIEDSLGHLVFFKALCKYTKQELKDQELVSEVEELLADIEMQFDKLLSILGGTN